MVLIDEIDQADLDFPNDLLSVLDEPAFTIAEAPIMSYDIVEKRKVSPIVVVTHNEEGLAAGLISPVCLSLH